MSIRNLVSYHIGLDLGQRVDHTAIVVVEQRVVPTARRNAATYEIERERQMDVTLVQRVRLGTGYYEVAEEVERLTHSDELRAGTVTTAVDATGVGEGVLAILNRRRLRGELYPVKITGGLEASYRAGTYPTPRTQLLLGVQRAFEVEGLGVAAGVGGWEELEKELRGMRMVQAAKGPRFETEGKHDDLVFALGLALFGARMRMLPVSGEAVRRRLGR